MHMQPISPPEMSATPHGSTEQSLLLEVSLCRETSGLTAPSTWRLPATASPWMSTLADLRLDAALRP